MEPKTAIFLSSRGISLAGVPILPTTHRALLGVLKNTQKATKELETTVSRTGLSIDSDYYSPATKDADVKNDAAAIVFASMLAAPELRIDANRRGMMRIVAGLGAVFDEKSGIRLVLQTIADTSVAAVSDSTWAAGPRAGQVLLWIESARSGVKSRRGIEAPVSVGWRVTRAGDATDIERIRLSRPAVAKKPLGTGDLPDGHPKPRDLLPLFWTADYLEAADEVRNGVLKHLDDQETLAWAESQARLIMAEIKRDRIWPADIVGTGETKEKWRRLLDKIDATVGSWIKKKRREKEIREIDVETARAAEELKEKEKTTVELYKSLAAICLDQSEHGIGDYIAEETLLALGMKPRLLAMIKREYAPTKEKKGS